MLRTHSLRYTTLVGVVRGEMLCNFFKVERPGTDVSTQYLNFGCLFESRVSGATGIGSNSRTPTNQTVHAFNRFRSFAGLISRNLVELVGKCSY